MGRRQASLGTPVPRMPTAKIIRSAEQQEETTTLLKRTDIIVKKLMDENDMLRNKHQRMVEESVDVLKQRLEDTKELITARRGD